MNTHVEINISAVNSNKYLTTVQGRFILGHYLGGNFIRTDTLKDFKLSYKTTTDNDVLSKVKTLLKIIMSSNYQYRNMVIIE